MTARPGWPAHRPNCPGSDELVVSTQTRVRGAWWWLRRCRFCGEVALEVAADVSQAGGAA